MLTLGYRCYLTITERIYLQKLLKKDMKLTKKKLNKKWIANIYAKLENLDPDIIKFEE